MRTGPVAERIEEIRAHMLQEQRGELACDHARTHREELLGYIDMLARDLEDKTDAHKGAESAPPFKKGDRVIVARDVRGDRRFLGRTGTVISGDVGEFAVQFDSRDVRDGLAAFDLAAFDAGELDLVVDAEAVSGA
jgi:hypothetical protein